MRVTTLRFDRESGWSGPLPDVEPDRSLTLCFGAPGYLNDTDPLRDLALGTGGNLLGCSTSGEIHHHEVADDTLSVAVMEFETTTVRSVAERITLDGSFSAGIAIGQRLADPSLKAIFILSEGLDVNGSELVRGINSVVPVDVVVTGGLAGDGPRFQQTWVIVDGKPVSGYVTAAGLYGNNVRRPRIEGWLGQVWAGANRHPLARQHRLRTEADPGAVPLQGSTSAILLPSFRPRVCSSRSRCVNPVRRSNWYAPSSVSTRPPSR